MNSEGGTYALDRITADKEKLQVRRRMEDVLTVLSLIFPENISERSKAIHQSNIGLGLKAWFVSILTFFSMLKEFCVYVGNFHSNC